ncbi:hypothetical protein GQ44DRAFT_621920 [Phaeosphaeriaceae sp. PMI808]|nr:hypothetical protein GQ44DRAFT_621920 [Phaeosphaeriaceae sp. PMI808]
MQADRCSVYGPQEWNTYLATALSDLEDLDVLRHFLGYPLPSAPPTLDEAAIVCLDVEWWWKEPKPTTEIGIAELMLRGQGPSAHVENILNGIQVAHARIIPNAHLRNGFRGAGNPENFQFGTSKFVTIDEARQVVVDTFVRPRQNGDGSLQPIILIGHAVDNEFDHIQRAFGVDLRSYRTVVKVIDTQYLAAQAGIVGPKGPNIGLRDLLEYFNVHIDNLHTAGNDTGGTLIAAILLALKDVLYPYCYPKPPAIMQGRHMQAVVERVMAIAKSHPPPSWGVVTYCTRCDRYNHFRDKCIAKVSCHICKNCNVPRLCNAHTTHMTSKCTYQYRDMPQPDRVTINELMEMEIVEKLDS